MPQKTHNLRRRRLPALLLAFFLSLVGLATVSPQARAAEVDAIIPESIKIIRDSDEQPDVYLWGMVRIEADWAIPDNSGKAGDTFTLGLPEEFKATRATFDLVGRDGDPLTYGTCALSSNELICTLNENVENKTDVGGSVWVEAQVVKTTDQSKLKFDLGNRGKVEVPLPNNQPGIGYGKRMPTDIQKSGWFPGEDARTREEDPSLVAWQIAIPGSKIADRSKVEITDTFKVEGMDLNVVPGYPKVFSSTLDPQCWNESKPDGCRKDYDESTTPSFTYQIDETADVVTATLDNKEENFSADRIYAMILWVKAPQPIAEGTKLVNKAMVDSTEVNAETTKRAAGGGTGAGRALGHLKVRKVVTGDNANSLPGDTTFPVTYSYEAGGSTKTGELSLTADGDFVDLPNIPNGSVVTLTEKTPEVAGFTFGDPVFSGEGVNDGVPDGNSAQIKIEGSKTIDLTLTNTVSKVTAAVTPVIPTVTPGVCKPGSTTPTPPTVTGADDTDQIDYSEPKITVDGSEATVTLTATPKGGATIDTAKLPEGWSVVNGVVTFSKTITQPDCSAKTVSPVSPKVTPGVCKPGSTTPTDPTVEIPKTEGVTYGEPKIERAGKNKVKVTLTAKPAHGQAFSIDKLPAGWTPNQDGSATYVQVLDDPACKVPSKPRLPKTGS